jgi:ribosomal protein S15P/S13E
MQKYWIDTSIAPKVASVDGTFYLASEVDAALAELQEWKDSSLMVESQWDAQRVGKEIGVGLGQSIRHFILPWIMKAKEQLAALTARIKELTEALEQLADDKGDAYWTSEEVRKIAKAALRRSYKTIDFLTPNATYVIMSSNNGDKP